MKIIFQIDGGIGKSIAATAVCKAIKRQYPQDQLYVITGYPEVFLCNPNVDKVFNFNNLNYFYTDHIEGQKVKTFLHNPYLQEEFINLEGHLIKVWCEMFGVRYNGELPELFITDAERAQYAQSFASQKPIMLIQTNGGAANQQNKYSWMRDLPISTAQQVVNHFAKDYNVVHIRRQDQPALQNTTPLQADFRAIAVLMSMSAARLFIDSFCQHVAAALHMRSVVCWVGNLPSQFGYDMHTNIIANPPTIRPELRHSVYSRYNISGQPTEFPYRSEQEVFDVNKIIAALVLDSPMHYLPPGYRRGYHIGSLRERVQRAVQNKNMVATRLLHILDVLDLNNVNRIVDIGSWHLEQSMEFSHLFPGAEIDAFEPVPSSFELCQWRIHALDDYRKNKIRAHNIAISDKVGPIPFYLIDPEKSSEPNAGLCSMFKFIDGLNGTPLGQNLVQKEISVQSDTLDNWAARNQVKEIDIMWMDAQGAELLVLKGADEMLKNTKVIFTEVGIKPYYEGHTLKTDIDEYLTARGFKELDGAFELNGFEYEANTIYVRN